jgi:hypothetical protein
MNVNLLIDYLSGLWQGQLYSLRRRSLKAMLKYSAISTFM